jgi:hypothetical protein
MNIEPRGWSCPHCNKAHAPDVKTCPEPVVADCWPPVTTPTIRPHCGPNTCGTFTAVYKHDPSIQSWNGLGQRVQ